MLFHLWRLQSFLLFLLLGKTYLFTSVSSASVQGVLHVVYCQDLRSLAAISSSPCLEIQGSPFPSSSQNILTYSDFRLIISRCQSPTPLLIVFSTCSIVVLQSVGISSADISKFGYKRDCFGKLEAKSSA